MATQKIEYQNKVAIDDVGVPEKNKITAENMNEIKEVVNNNADNFDETTAAINERIDTANNAINNIVENTYTKTETDEKLAQKADISDIPTDLSQLSNATTKFVNETQLQEETTARENADNDLQGQIDAIVAASDVVDIVGTYQELENYDTSHLGDNDIIKVLQDSTHNNATSYYRWKKQSSTWQYIGSEGPYYTKSESNEKFVEKETGKGLSTNDFTNAYREKLDDIESGAEINIIEKVKLNGTELPISNKEVNIPVDDTLNNTSTNPIQNKKVFEALEGKEDSSNKTDTLNPESTSTQYPNAEVVYNALVEKQNQIDELQEENNKLKADHPPINETGTELTLNGTGDFELALSPKGNITQDGEPSPTNPSPVKVVDGEYEVEVENKNYFKAEEAFASQIQAGLVSINDKGQVVLNGTFNWQNRAISVTLPAGTYTGQGGNSNGSLVLHLFWLGGDSSLNKKTPVTYTEETTLTGYITSGTYENRILEPMILKQTTYQEVDYVPYNGESLEIDTSPNPLYSENDLYFKAVNGDKFYESLTSEQKASLESGKWYVHNEWGKYVFNGTETFNKNLADTSNTLFYVTNIMNFDLTNGNNSKCNYLTQKTLATLNVNNEEGFFCNTTSSNYVIYMNIKTELNTGASVKAKIKDLYDNNTPMYFIYPLANPTNTPITNTTLINQLEALLTLTAYQDQTNISQTHNEAQADMIINAQTIMSMRYLQNEIEELKQAILNS